MKIIGFNGSPRKGGNTSTIMKEMLKGAQEGGADIELIHLSDFHIEGCIGCEKCRKDKTCTQFYDGMHLLYPKIEQAQGIILGSPTYNYTMTPLMKCFIDRLYPYFDFSEQRPGPYSSRLANRGKRALIFGVCEQIAQEEMKYNIPVMRDAIHVVGYEIVGTLYFTGHFKANSASGDRETMQRAFVSGNTFAQTTQEKEN